MSTRAVATSTLWQIASQVTMAALSILTVKFVAIGLTKELAGNYNSAYGYLQLFGILADFGLYAVAIKELSRRERKEEVLSALIILRSIILALSLGSALLFVWLLPAWQGTPFPSGVLIASLVPFFTLLAGILRSVFQITYKMQYVFIAEVTQRIVSVGLIAAAILLWDVRGSDSIAMYHFFLLAGGIGAFVLFFLSLTYADRLMKIRIHVNTALIRSIFWDAFPYGIAFLCMALYRQFDVTMIALLRPDFDLQNAYYGFVLRMTDMGFIIPTFLLNSTLPILSDRDAKGEDTRSLLGKTLFLLLLLGSISALFAFLWARPLIQLLTTESYLSTALQPGSDSALQYMSVPLFLNGLILFSFYTLLTRHAWRRLVLTLLIGVAVSLTLNLMFIPEHGFMGAATASVVTHIILAVLLLPQALNVLPATLTKIQWGQWIGFSTGLLACLMILRPLLQSELHTVIGLGTATVVMGGMAWLFGLLRLIRQD